MKSPSASGEILPLRGLRAVADEKCCSLYRLYQRISDHLAESDGPRWGAGWSIDEFACPRR